MPLFAADKVRVGGNAVSRVYRGAGLLWQTAAASAAPTLYDTFGGRDDSKWIGWDSGGAGGPFITVTGGYVQIAAAPGYPGLESVATFDLTAEPLIVGISQRPEVGNGTTAATVEVFVADGDRWNFGWTNGGSYLEYFLAGVQQPGMYGAGYTAGTSGWRIRVDGTDVRFETTTAVDITATAAVWTLRYTRPAAELPALTALKVRLKAGYYGTEATPGVARFTEVRGDSDAEATLPPGSPTAAPTVGSAE